MVCAFSGHRPQRLPWGTREEDPHCLALKKRLRQELEALAGKGYDTFLCGMALGCDTYFAEAVLALRETDPSVRLWAALPCRTQADHWTEADRARYRAILDRCDRVDVLQEEYSAACMRSRNLWMLEQADCLMTVYDGGLGGTAWTAAEARRRSLPVISLWL